MNCNDVNKNQLSNDYLTLDTEQLSSLLADILSIHNLMIVI